MANFLTDATKLKSLMVILADHQPGPDPQTKRGSYARAAITVSLRAINHSF